MAGRTGYTAVSNGDPMEGPSQITDVYEHFDAIIGENVSTTADLPASGKWVGRHIFVAADNSDYVWDGSGWKVPAFFQAAPTLDSKLTPVTGYPPMVTRSGRACTAGGLVSVASGAQSQSLMTVPSWAIPTWLSSNQMVIGSWYTASRLIGAVTINSSGVISASTNYGTIQSFPTGNAAFHAAWGV